jgi:anaerobic glycerol-3-phosphate dehydrogenase
LLQGFQAALLAPRLKKAIEFDSVKALAVNLPYLDKVREKSCDFITKHLKIRISGSKIGI